MLQRPLCFVLMPFGRKKDELGRTIDFDAVYREVIAPAIDQAGLEPIRADEEQVGGTIHKPMFERLLLCDFAIADLTGANPNVYYELGIRHALRPRSTVLLACEGAVRPFDVAPLRTWSYRVDSQGKPADAPASATAIGERLRTVVGDESDDSPVFELVEIVELPRIKVAHEKTDIFRDHVASSRLFKNRLDAAVRGGRQAVKELAADPALQDLHLVEADIIVNLFLAHRSVGDFTAMADMYPRMPRHLKNTVMMREQYALALNRLGRGSEAEKELKDLIQQYGATGENCGLLGRVYKDRWQKAVESGDTFVAEGLLQEALETYLQGFEADWRDTYPGVNALTLFEMLETPDPRRDEVLPVVKYAALRRARAATADYWDWATVLEIAVLARNQADARQALRTALVRAKESYAPKSTANNLRMIREKRALSGEDVGWLQTIEAELIKRADALETGERVSASA